MISGNQLPVQQTELGQPQGLVLFKVNIQNVPPVAFEAILSVWQKLVNIDRNRNLKKYIYHCFST